VEQTCLESKVAWKPAMEYFGRDVLWNERRVCSRALGIHIPVENAVYDRYYRVLSGRKAYGYCNEVEVAQVGGNRHTRAAAGFEYGQDMGQELGLH